MNLNKQNVILQEESTFVKKCDLLLTLSINLMYV